MTKRMPIWIALAGNVLVVAVTLSLYGWNAESVYAAARNTARFSLLWFAAGFGAPRRQTSLIQAFVAAHMVHFAVVGVLLATFGSAQLSQHPGRVLPIVVIGFAVVAGAGLTAAPRTSRLYTAVHKVTLYAVFLILFLAFVNNKVKPLRFLVVPLGLALILRWTRGVSFHRAAGQ